MAASLPPLPQETLDEYKALFDRYDADGDGFVTEAELTSVLKEIKMYKSAYQVKTLINEVDSNNNGTIEWNELLAMVNNERARAKKGKKSTSQFAAVIQKSQTLLQVKGTQAGAVHSLSEEELAAFTEHINNLLSDDEDLKSIMPINADNHGLLTAVKDGVLLAKFINLAQPDTIDMRAVNIPPAGKSLSLFQINENLNLAVQAAKSIGVVTTNVGASELSNGEQFPHLVLGVIWQLVKLQLLNQIDLKSHPELIRLLEDGEELADLLRLSPEQLLLRWFNYHLKNAGHPRRVGNFGPHVADSECYTILLNQIAPGLCDKSGLAITDPEARGQTVIDNANKLDAQTFIKARDIVSGNSRLNLAFTAAIFNQSPGLDMLTEEEEIEMAGLMDDDLGDSREERAFRMWINSLGADDVYINSLFENLQNGLVLLKVIDKIEPGTVDWKQVEMQPRHKLKKVSNNNLAVSICKKDPFNLSLVGIGGTDITQGNKTLVLALTWQLMRYHTVKHVAKAQAHIFGGKAVTDAMMVDWANARVAADGSPIQIKSFKDQRLNDGLFFCDLLKAIEPRIVNPEFVNRESDAEEDRLLNAKYAISVARKLGATLFLLPEDITEVKPKMMLTFIASIMAIDN